jgi:hypothetical protein
MNLSEDRVKHHTNGPWLCGGLILEIKMTAKYKRPCTKPVCGFNWISLKKRALRLNETENQAAVI